MTVFNIQKPDEWLLTRATKWEVTAENRDEFLHLELFENSTRKFT